MNTGLLILLTLGACSFVPPSTIATPRAPAPIAASFARTWNAVIDVFADKNIPIRTIDRASGFIATDALSAAGSDTTWADCGTGPLGGTLRPTLATYNVLVRSDSAASTVHVTVTWSSVAGGQCVTRGVWEGELEQLIRKKAETR